MATHSSILAWKMPWSEEGGRLQSMGSQRAGHDLVGKKPWSCFPGQEPLPTTQTTLAFCRKKASSLTYQEVHTLARKLTKGRAKHPLDPVLLHCQDRDVAG